MTNAERIVELTRAYEQGFISDAEFQTRLAELSPDTSAPSGNISDLAKDALTSSLAKDMAAGAASGTLIASVVPLIGTATGAMVGAAIGAFKNLDK